MGMAQFIDGRLLLPMGPFQATGQLVDIILQLGQLAAQITAATKLLVAIAQGAQQTGEIPQGGGDLASQVMGDPQANDDGEQGGEQAGQ